MLLQWEAGKESEKGEGEKGQGEKGEGEMLEGEGKKGIERGRPKVPLTPSFTATDPSQIVELGNHGDFRA